MAVVQTLIGNIKGPQGEQGAQGEQGEQGDAATISVGSVTTVPYGTNASVVNSGTEKEAILDFRIPQGRPGEQVTQLDNLVLNSITEPSTEFPIPAIGDIGSVLFGKVSKWFSDMTALVATKLNVANVVNNLTTTASGYALDARQGKALNDTIVALFENVRLRNPYEYANLNIDKINAEYGYVYRVRSDVQSGTFPSGAGNAGLLIGYSLYRDNALLYGSQMMLTFGGNGAYRRSADYNASGGSWSTWTAV